MRRSAAQREEGSVLMLMPQPMTQEIQSWVPMERYTAWKYLLSLDREHVRELAAAASLPGRGWNGEGDTCQRGEWITDLRVVMGDNSCSPKELIRAAF